MTCCSEVVSTEQDLIKQITGISSEQDLITALNAQKDEYDVLRAAAVTEEAAAMDVMVANMEGALGAEVEHSDRVPLVGISSHSNKEDGPTVCVV